MWVGISCESGLFTLEGWVIDGAGQLGRWSGRCWLQRTKVSFGIWFFRGVAWQEGKPYLVDVRARMIR